MSVKNRPPWPRIGVLVATCMMLYACAAPSAPSERASSTPVRANHQPANPPSLPVTQVIDARPVALVDGRSVEWAELKPILNELAGGEALQEVVLDRLIERELQQRGLSVTEDDIAHERQVLVQSLNQDINVAVRLLDDLRDKQRLGPVRFRALLRRNAALRRLVQDQVQISEAGLQRTFDLIYGERRQVRLITTPVLGDAEEARRRIEDGEPFPDVAVEVSTDVSAARGGLLEPIAQSDPRYPESIRQAMWKLEPGQVSAPILVDNQYALLQLVRVIEPTAWFLEEHRDEVIRVARLNQERLLMERLARQLLTNVTITFFDDSIESRFRALRRRDASLVEP